MTDEGFGMTSEGFGMTGTKRLGMMGFLTELVLREEKDFSLRSK